MTTFRIVELENGKFAVQKWLLVTWRFCSLHSPGLTWGGKEEIYEFCIADLLEEAEKSLDKNIKAIEMKKRKKPSVIRIVKTVTV